MKLLKFRNNHVIDKLWNQIINYVQIKTLYKIWDQFKNDIMVKLKI